MRITQKIIDLRTTPFLFFIILCLGFSFSCAKKTLPKQGIKGQPPVKIEKEKDSATGAQKEIIRAEPKPFASNATPKARASSQLVEQGKSFLSKSNFLEAERSFQEALNIDPNNGIAYYYLAKAKYELRQLIQASGILDKAEELLSGSKEWMEAVSILRQMIKEQRQ